MKKSNIIALVIIIVILCIFFINTSLISQQNRPSLDSILGSEKQVNKQDHIYSYIFALISSLHNLYLSTQEQQEISSTYQTSDQDVQLMTVMLQVDTDLTNALSLLRPYINDNDQAIKGTAGLLYVDILKYQQTIKASVEAFRNLASEQGLKDLKYGVAQMESTQRNIENDLLRNIFPVIKGIIQIPTDTDKQIGTINYSISVTQRKDLINEISRTFGTNMNNYSDNVYTIAAKVLQLNLTPDTYEEQKTLKL